MPSAGTVAGDGFFDEFYEQLRYDAHLSDITDTIMAEKDEDLIQDEKLRFYECLLKEDVLLEKKCRGMSLAM